MNLRQTHLVLRKVASIGAICGALAALLLATGTVGARASKSSRKEQSAEKAHSPVFVQEKGRFRIVVDGKEAGKEDFEISRDGPGWVARGNAEVTPPQGEATKLSATLRLNADGTPKHYEWSSQGAKKASATVDFAGGTATVELRLEGSKPFTQQFFFNTPNVVILDNNFYHQYALLARLYDWQKKGPQAFQVFVPQSMAPGKVTLEDAGPEMIGGAKAELLRVRSEDLEIDLYLDNLKLVRLAAPAANAEAIRE
jgi:hypothetical protein